MDNKAMFKLSYGLFVLTANENGFDNGCIINTCGQVTTTPNRISIAVRSVIARKAADNRRAQTGSSASVAKSKLTAAMVNTPMEPET